MELFLILISALIANSVSSSLNPCPDNLQWDQARQTCLGCKLDTVYNNILGKCIDIYNTTCGQGYQFDRGEKKCVDIDECSNRDDICQKNEFCRNLPGTYKCIVREYCGQGYEFNVLSQSCRDINECEQNMNFCDNNLVCENVPGSFRCRQPCPANKQYYWNSACHQCQEGFIFNKSMQQCQDIDECVGPYKLECARYREICVKKPGLSACVTHCSGGTVAFNDQCYDIDECATNIHNCSQNQKCINEFGFFMCSDIQCKENELFDNVTKECYCKPGYKLDLYTNTCEDINECENEIPPCGSNGRCINKLGFYQCLCDLGYHFANGTCADVNECLSVEGVCGHLECQNLLGSFACVCPRGFKMNNWNSCEDINECSDNPGICTSESVLFNEKYQCYNLIGSYKCIKSFCPTEYETIEGPYNTRICQLINHQCSYNDEESCIQQLPDKLVYKVVEIRSVDIAPYRIAVIELGDQDFNSYYVKMKVRKFTIKGMKQNVEGANAIISLSEDKDERSFFFDVIRTLSDSTEVVVDIYLKSNHDNREKIHSFYQIYVFVNNYVF